MTASAYSVEESARLGRFPFTQMMRDGKSRISTGSSQYRFAIGLGAAVAAFVVAAFWHWIVVTVPAGHVAIKWHRFLGGTDTAHVYSEGTRLIFPWDKIEIYESRVQQVNRDFEVLTLDGLTMTINIALRFRVNEDTVGQLHKRVGPDYLERLLIPAVGSYARQVFSQNSTENIYTARRSSIQEEVKQAIIADLTPRSAGNSPKQDGRWLVVEDVLIRNMRFPPVVQAAIDRKMEQQQLKQEYAYRLEREHLESERKEVEAQGIAKFQTIVRAGISDGYLRWKGIDATLALAQSPNAKVVLIGAPKDGMPLILGSDATSASVGKTREGDETSADTPIAQGPGTKEAKRVDVTHAPSASSSDSTARAAVDRPTMRALLGHSQALSLPDYVAPTQIRRVPSNPQVNVPTYVWPDVSFQPSP